MVKNNLSRILTAVFLVFSLTILSPGLTAAVSFSGSVESGANAARGINVPTELLGNGGVITTVINTLLFVVGFLSVVMLIFGGLRYIISGGNSSAVTNAKNTVLYAIVGLIIALFAYAIVNFVIGSLTGATATTGTNL